MSARDVVVIGGGPAGLSAALHLVRAGVTVTVIDGNRPRHAATLHAHGFLTRDGVSPLELRRLGRDEVSSYHGAEVVQGTVTEARRTHAGFAFTFRELRGSETRTVQASRALLAVGLRESFPEIRHLRAFYGTAIHSCIGCDAYEKRGSRMFLLGGTPEILGDALQLGWTTDDLVVCTNGSGALDADAVALLEERGVRVRDTPVAEVLGERATMTGLRFVDGSVLERDTGFVRPEWSVPLEFMGVLTPECDAAGSIRADGGGRTSLPGLYAAGDAVAPGPSSLIESAGSGARVAAQILRDMVSVALTDGRAEASPGAGDGEDSVM